MRSGLIPAAVPALAPAVPAPVALVAPVPAAVLKLLGGCSGT